MTKIDSQTERERREYFRVDDTLGIRIRPIDNQAVSDIPAATYQLIQELSQASNEFNAWLRQLSEHSRETAECIRALARRQDVLVDYLLLEQFTDKLPLTPVSLSAGGISFWSATAWPVGSVLQLEILLNEPLALICCPAKVVQQHPENQGYALGLIYTDISELDRDVLAKRVLLAELRQRRARQQQND